MDAQRLADDYSEIVWLEGAGMENELGGNLQPTPLEHKTNFVMARTG